MVRLKAGEKKILAVIDEIRFNSTMVRLKDGGMACDGQMHTGFNSTMVRLKVLVFPNEVIGALSFNSTMVRLKAVRLSRQHLFPDRFQFHNGSIKRNR